MQQQAQTGMPRPLIRTVAVKMTHAGRTRDHNEDFVAIEIPGKEALKIKGSLNLVADGMGGHQAGEVASQRAAEVIASEYYADPDIDIAVSLNRAMHKANAAVFQMAQVNTQRAGMGTTAVVAVVRGSEVHIANVGDSRAYLLRRGELTQITKDHSFVQEQIDANILTPEAARIHPQRNVITRALGHKPQIQVDTFEGELTPGDVLLLCSDGLTGPVRDEEIAAAVKQHPPQEAVIHLTNVANERGGPDNISAVLVQALPYDPDSAPAIEVAPGAQPPPPPAAKPSPATSARTAGGQRHFIVWGLLGLSLLALIVAGGIFTLGGNGDQLPTTTLVATLTPFVTPTSDISPSSTAATVISETATVPTAQTAEPILPTSTSIPPTPTPTSTPTPLPCRPALPTQLVAPPPGANYPSNVEVVFQWAGGRLCDNLLWQVTINGQPDFCPATTESQVTCQLAPGEYQWRVEIWDTSGRPVQGMMTPPRSIIITSPVLPTSPPADKPTPEAQPTPTSIPPTQQPPTEPAPTRTPPPP